jgi:hypothetical protein
MAAIGANDHEDRLSVDGDAADLLECCGIGGQDLVTADSREQEPVACQPPAFEVRHLVNG